MAEFSARKKGALRYFFIVLTHRSYPRRGSPPWRSLELLANVHFWPKGDVSTLLGVDWARRNSSSTNVLPIGNLSFVPPVVLIAGLLDCGFWQCHAQVFAILFRRCFVGEFDNSIVVFANDRLNLRNVRAEELLAPAHGMRMQKRWDAHRKSDV